MLVVTVELTVTFMSLQTAEIFYNYFINSIEEVVVDFRYATNNQYIHTNAKAYYIGITEEDLDVIMKGIRTSIFVSDARNLNNSHYFYLVWVQLG